MKTLPLNQSKQRENKAFGELSSYSELSKLISESNCAQREGFFQEYPIYCSELLHFFPPPNLEDKQAQKPYINILLALPLQSYSKGKIL